MKALEFLKNAKLDTPVKWVELDEAIAELEALENRSCEGCIYAKLAKDSSMKEIPNNISTCYHDFKCKRYYTDKWESK